MQEDESSSLILSTTTTLVPLSPFLCVCILYYVSHLALATVYPPMNYILSPFYKGGDLETLRNLLKDPQLENKTKKSQNPN